MAPVLEEFFEVGDGSELLGYCNGWGVLEGVREKLESMEDAVLVRDGGLGEVVVTKLDCVGEDKGFDEGVDGVEATVVVECSSDLETIAASEGPGLACAGFVVDENWAADGANGSGVKVEEAVVIFPGGHFGGGGGLTKEVEGEFCLGKQLVPKEVGEGAGGRGRRRCRGSGL